MGRIRNFFNRLFGKRPKALNEGNEIKRTSNVDIRPLDLENKDEKDMGFKEDLQKNTVQKDEMNFNETLDYFIQDQKLELICKNPRGREKLGQMLEKVFQKENVEHKDGVYDKYLVDNAIFKYFGETPKEERRSISFEDRDVYYSDYQKRNTEFAPGCKKTTINVNDFGELNEVVEGRSPFCYNIHPDDKDKPIELYYSKCERHYEKSGIEDLRIDQEFISKDGTRGKGRQARPKYDYALLDYHRPYHPDGYEGTLSRRTDGIMVNIVNNKNGKTEHRRAYIHSEHGVDDIRYNHSCDCNELPEYKDMTDEQKENFKSLAVSAISKSKYKQDLVNQTPGVEMEDIEKNKSRE